MKQLLKNVSLLATVNHNRGGATADMKLLSIVVGGRASLVVRLAYKKSPLTHI